MQVLFRTAYLWLKDIPPFVFYLLLVLIGGVVCSGSVQPPVAEKCM